MATNGPADVMWTPDAAYRQTSNLARYMRGIEADLGTPLGDYMSLWQWSVTDLEAFWRSIWQLADIPGSSEPSVMLADDRMPGAQWCPDARCNYAAQLMRSRARSGPAIIAVSESRPTREISFEQLRSEAGALARTLERLGVVSGDRVVAYLPNIPEAIVGLIACAAIGAVWSICAPDFGIDGVLARFAQLSPRVLIAADGYRFGGRDYDRRAEVAQLVDGLPTLTDTIWVDNLGIGSPPVPATASPPVPTTAWSDAVAAPAALEFASLPFDHPLWVLFSSGTTGAPKGIVHGHGGIILEHFKGLGLGMDLTPDDRLLMLGSTSWMVWNLLASALMHGTTVVVMDGNPTYPDPSRLWTIVAEQRVSVLGVGASLIHTWAKRDLAPRDQVDLGALRQLLSTGSPLSHDGHEWVRDRLGQRVWLNSTSGGTDVCSAFVGGCVLLPVRAGRLQAPALGVAAEAWDDQSRSVIGRTGELVITRPMPSMPLRFYGDEDGSRYRASYFSHFEGVWRHGDFIEFDPDGSSVIHGRSDSTLNRNGVRIGSAEIYAVVETLDSVREALVVGVEYGEDYYMPLFVVLEPGADIEATREAIVGAIRRAMSPRHVPDEIIEAPGIPHTRTGKKLEVPIKRLLQGSEVGDVLDTSAVDDAELISFYARFAANHLDQERSAHV